MNSKQIEILFAIIFLYGSVQCAQNCSCVVFRLDDIQDYYLYTAQVEVMKVFQTRKIPMTVGIIANQFGQDTRVLDFIKQGIADASWDYEIADHGWDHEDFSTFTYAQQYNLLNQAVTKIKSVLGVPSVPSFIPPFNAFNADTVTALKTLGFTHMTSQTELDPEPYPLTGIQLFFRIF